MRFFTTDHSIFLINELQQNKKKRRTLGNVADIAKFNLELHVVSLILFKIFYPLMKGSDI